jgi:hypothetical protein
MVEAEISMGIFVWSSADPMGKLSSKYAFIIASNIKSCLDAAFTFGALFV